MQTCLTLGFYMFTRYDGVIKIGERKTGSNWKVSNNSIEWSELPFA